MSTPIPNELSIALLIASIDAAEMSPVTAAVKKFPDKDATWETVNARLLEELQALKAKTKRSECLLAAMKQCTICSKTEHTTDVCLYNPNNTSGRKNRNKSDNRGANQGEQQQSGNNRHPSKSCDVKERAAVALVMMAQHRPNNSGRMTPDSRTTAHMVTNAGILDDATKFDVGIALRDDPLVKASHQWDTAISRTPLSLSITLASSDLNMDLLSVPALADKGLCVFFMPGKAYIKDKNDEMSVVGTVNKEAGGLYSIGINENCWETSFEDGLGRAIMAKAFALSVDKHEGISQEDKDMEQPHSGTNNSWDCNSNEDDRGDN